MYSDHPLFKLPEPHTKLMRYMSYSKFADLLFRRALYFAPVDSLYDQYEGTLPHPYSAVGLTAQIDYGDISEDERHNVEKVLKDHREGMRNCTMVNSWCLSEHETMSMWDRYAPTDGLAVSTDVKSLQVSLLDSAPVFIGEVQYIDYDADFFKLGVGHAFNALIPFLHKRREYADEREVRAVVSTLGVNQNTSGLTYQSVDLRCLIKEVIVSPNAPYWLIPLIQNDLNQSSIDALARISTLSKVPTL